MEKEKTEKTNSWFSSLISNINTLGEELGLDDSGTDKMRDFVIDNARAQYKAGNRSGIGWAFAQAAKRAEQHPA